jgi:cyclophilin family peptidyl-prolyl cis-trans isomerase
VILTQAIFRVFFYFRVLRKKPAFFRGAVCAFLVAMLASPQISGANNTIVRMVTNVDGGSFNVELYDAEAPNTVTNFLKYVNRGDYNISVIHRSEPGFVIQGGGYALIDFFGSQYFYDFPKDPPILNEFSPSRSNIRGTIAMAKTSDPDSATSEWFINLDDNSATLDDTNNSGGFTIFGHVLDPGMSVVDTISNLKIRPGYVMFTDSTQRYFGQLPVVGETDFFVLVEQICINVDGDGACPDVEDMAPGEDGNGDGTPDRDQANVTTIRTLLGATATFEADPMMRLDPVYAVSASTVYSWLSTFKSPPDQSAHLNNGMYSFSMTGVNGPAGSIVTMYDGASARPTHYYAYGPTPGNPAPHWYDFMFDGVTGAEIKSDRIILHFVDGMRGDDDLTVNDSITHTGAQAVVTAVDDGSAQGGGCSIVGIPSDVTHSGDWIVVSLFLAMLALVRRRARRRVQHERVTNIASP